MLKSGCCKTSVRRGVVEDAGESANEQNGKSEGVHGGQGRENHENNPTTNYKLTYFNFRVGGEMIRLMFHYCNVQFEDVRVSMDDWPTLKPDMKWLKLPELEAYDTKIYSCTAICRFLAKKLNLAGKDDIENAHIDEVVDICQELRTTWTKYNFEENSATKEELKESFGGLLSEYLPKINNMIEGNPAGWLVGSRCSWGDIFLANFMDVCEDTVDRNLLDKYPAVKSVKEKIFTANHMKSYLQSRPKTNF